MPPRALQVRLDALPPFRPVVTRLMAELSGEPSGFRRIRGLVSEDPALAAQVLRLANSALFGRRGEVTDLLTALTLIGIDRLRALVLTYGVRHLFRPLARLPQARAIWKHSLATAILAADLALDQDGGMMQCYTAGLLHDLGRLVLLASAPEAYALLLEQASSAAHCLDLETELFRVNHAEAGARAMRRYGLPQELAAAARLHHHADPLELSRTDPDAALIASSCRLAACAGFAVVAEPPAAASPQGNPDPDSPEQDDLCLYLRERVDEIERGLGLALQTA
ncbi:MAG: HDOD domain-containing protein [Bryobacteraceae bacterium]|jgi:putative nucleotidyltransferase with HDIG domain